MGRKNLIRTSEHPYHINARSNNRDWFDLPLEDAFEVFCDVIPSALKKHEVSLHGFVLMSNHFHMLASTPKSNLDKFMHQLMTNTSKRLRVRALRTNHVYGGRYKWSIINSEQYFANCFRYIYQNPVRAKIVTKVEQYPFSTASVSKNKLTALCDLETTGYSGFVPDKKEELSMWLNETIDAVIVERTRCGLKRPTFELGVNPVSRRKIALSECAR